MNNITIRKVAMENGIKLWQIAEALGMSEFTLSRYLRHQLNDEDTKRVLHVIEQLKEGFHE